MKQSAVALVAAGACVASAMCCGRPGPGADAGTDDAGALEDAGPGGAGCRTESDTAFCARWGKDCGVFSAAVTLLSLAKKKAWLHTLRAVDFGSC